MILVFGGTTEGRKAAEVLEAGQGQFYYSTKTGEQDVPLRHGQAVSGAMDEEAMLRFCQENNVRLIVDAAHPFATQLHHTIAQVATSLNLPVVRYERIFPPHDPDIIWCNDFDDAISKIACRVLLATTGVQSIARLKPLESRGIRIIYRILNRESSLQLAYKQGATDAQLCLYPETADADAILMKESGTTGGFTEKADEARRKGMKIYAIRRPETPTSFRCINGPHGLRRMVEQLLPDFFPLRSGLTTGTCATAAAVAALNLTENSELRTERYDYQTENSELRTERHDYQTENLELRTERYDYLQRENSGSDSNGKTNHTSQLSTLNSQLKNTSQLSTLNSQLKNTSQLSTLNSQLKNTSQLSTLNSQLKITSQLSTINSQLPPSVPVILPDGETIMVDVGYGDGYAYCIKDGGDDPDVTNGIEVRATVTMTGTQEGRGEAPAIRIVGGEGVGRFTLPGFDYPPGEPAINKGPRKMIEQNILANLKTERTENSELRTERHTQLSTLNSQLKITSQLSTLNSQLKITSQLTITISVPGGEEIARRTFNPRLGIEGGISIIGVSGIVKPFSEEAFIDSIRKCMQVAKASGAPRLVLNSGGKSERFVKARYPDLPRQAFVEYGNYIGQTLQMAHELGFAAVTLGVMLGKAVKLAEGQLDTHSRRGTMNKHFIAQMLTEAGCSLDLAPLTLARELWNLIPADRLRPFASVVIGHCLQHCSPLLPNASLTILLIDDEGEIYNC